VKLARSEAARPAPHGLPPRKSQQCPVVPHPDSPG
jgi:hypothetical protein